MRKLGSPRGAGQAVLGRAPAREPTPDYWLSMRVANVVLGGIVLSVAVASLWLTLQGRESGLQTALIWALLVLNVGWNKFVGWWKIHGSRAELIRFVVCAPMTTAVYTLGWGPFERLWLLAAITTVGVCVGLSVESRRIAPGVAATLGYSGSLFIGDSLHRHPDPVHTAIHVVTLIVIGIFLTAVTALVGRSLETARVERAHADDARRALEAAQAELIETARSAGMAEIASGVLHNVGNVLNSINVSAQVVRERLTTLPRLKRVSELVKEHGERPEFWQGTKGRVIPSYIAELSNALEAALCEADGELQTLERNVDHVRRIVAMQQDYAGRFASQSDRFDVARLISEAIRFERLGFEGQILPIQTSVDPDLHLFSDFHRLVQVLVNLIRNARYATLELPRGDSPLVTVSARGYGSGIQLCVHDRGVGIAADVLPNIFRHGFTTRSDGNGFGLHMSALVVQQLGGQIRAESEGLGRGASFFVELPGDSEA